MMSLCLWWRHRTNFQGYVPLHTVVGCRNSFLRSRLRDWKYPSDCWVTVKHIANLSRLKRLPQRGSNRGPLGQRILQSECSSTVLAGPGKVPSYSKVKYSVLLKNKTRKHENIKSKECFRLHRRKNNQSDRKWKQWNIFSFSLLMDRDGGINHRHHIG